MLDEYMWLTGGIQFFELLTGDYLFDPQPGGKYDKDDDHVAQILELLGEMPKSLALSGKYSHEIFNRKGESHDIHVCHNTHRNHLIGELRHISRLRFWPMMSVLKEKYLMEQDDAELLSSFLMPMMHYYPDSRATAAELVKHPWLDGVVVQGDIEMAERTHQLEMDRLNRVEQQRQASASPGKAEKDKGKAKDVKEVKESKEKGSALDEVKKLGPAVKGIIGMGRI
jgi:serine/threonine-protein kinase SRPK3